MVGMELAVMKAMKEEELEDIQIQKSKDLMLYSKALSLISYDGKDLTDDQEKIGLFRKIRRTDMIEFINAMDKIKFGIQDERNFECPICGEVEQRLLQREFMFYEFVPLDTDAKHRLEGTPGINVHFGI